MEETGFYQQNIKDIFATAFEESFSHEAFVPDIIIKAGPEKSELYCHRLVLAASSNYLSSILSSVTPGTTPVILLPDISVFVVELILAYIYYGEVVIPSEKHDEFVDACDMLMIKYPVNDSLKENTASEIIVIELEVKEERKDENQPIQMETLKLANQKKRKKNKKHSKQRKMRDLELDGKKISNKKGMFKRASVTPKLAKTAQEQLYVRIRRAYTSLQIPITPKIEKRISESKIVVEDDVLIKGVHVCGICHPAKMHSVYPVYRIGGNVSFQTDYLKRHLKNSHTEVL